MSDPFWRRGKGNLEGIFPQPAPKQDEKAGVEQVLERLEKVRTSGEGWMAQCPVHDDRVQSLSIARGEKGGVVLNCFAGCGFEEIREALDFKPGELSAPKPPGANGSTNGSGGHVVATYPYCDEDGVVLFEKIRLEPKTFRQRRSDGDGWTWKLGDVRRVLYRLPDVLRAASDVLVFVVEGEKDADNLATLGLVTTTNPEGAGKWRPEYTEALRGRRVVVIPDNDEPGRQHANVVRAALEGIAREVRVLELPGLPDKGDASDWLAAGGTREALLELVEAAPADAREAPAPKSAARWSGKPVPLREWLLADWIPMKQVTALYGDGGTGKTLLGQQIGTVVSMNRPFFGIDTKGGVVLGYFCEDSDEELHRRQAAINAWAKVEFQALERWYPISRAGQDNLLMTFDAGGTGHLTPFWHEMVATVAALRPVLLIVDTAADTFGGNENIRPQVRQFVQGALTRIAIEYGCAVLLLAHPSVSGMQSGEGTGGSTAWNNTVRSRLYLHQEPGDIATILTRKKSNYSARGERIELHWAEGAFWQSGSKLVAKAMENGDQATFLACLRRAQDQGINVSTHPKGSYAPKMFLKYREAQGVSMRRLEKAMEAVLESGAVTLELNDKGRMHLRVEGYTPKRMGSKGGQTPTKIPDQPIPEVSKPLDEKPPTSVL